MLAVAWVLGVLLQNAESFVSGMKQLGFGGRKLKQLVEEVANEALRTSFWIWFMREEREWCNIQQGKGCSVKFSKLLLFNISVVFRLQ